MARWLIVVTEEVSLVCQIIVSFLQVVGVARQLQLEWPSRLDGLMSYIVDHLDISSAAGNYLALECSIIGGPERKQIVRSILIVLIPGKTSIE